MMQTHGVKPTPQTYSCLVLASVRSGQQQLALQLFKKGLKEVPPPSPPPPTSPFAVGVPGPLTPACFAAAF